MILWLNPSTGVSGDMLLGALLGLGAPLEGVRSAIAATGVSNWSLDVDEVDVNGIAATRAVVDAPDAGPARNARELLARAGRATPEPVATMACAAIGSIAEAEARLHGHHVDEVHLHEIGGLDTIVDTVGVAAALHLLEVSAVFCAPIAVGVGTVNTAHGTLPAPAPATVRLLTDARIVAVDLDGETVTPTGIALLRAMGTRFAQPPVMTVRATAFGAGTKRFPNRPNMVTAILGDAVAPAPGEPMVKIETNVDDVTGEELGHVISAALSAGAADAWCTPTVMKKGRPAHEIHVLCHPDDVPAVEELLLAETGSLGVRRSVVDRSAVARTHHTVDVEGHPVRVKQGPWRTKPEHDDAVQVAAHLGVSVRAVKEHVLQQFGSPIRRLGHRDASAR